MPGRYDASLGLPTAGPPGATRELRATGLVVRGDTFLPGRCESGPGLPSRGHSWCDPGAVATVRVVLPPFGDARRLRFASWSMAEPCS